MRWENTEQFFKLDKPVPGEKGSGLPYGAWYCSDTATSEVRIPLPRRAFLSVQASRLTLMPGTGVPL